MVRFAFFVLPLLVGALVACGFDTPSQRSIRTPPSNPTPPPPGQQGNSQYASDPDGKAVFPLKTLEQSQADDAIGAAADSIATKRDQGVKSVVDALGPNAPSTKIDGSTIGNPLPISSWVANGSNGPVPAGDKAYAKFFACPIEAPDVGTSQTCADMVAGAAQQAQLQIDRQTGAIPQTVAQNNPGAPQSALDFITSWSQTALQHGADVAVIQVQAALRQEGKCDADLGKWAVAHLVGYEQGINLVLNGLGNGQQSPRAWAIAQVTAACVRQTDTVAIQAGQMAQGLVQQFIAAHALCTGFDYAKDNKNLVNAEGHRSNGIPEGINAEVQVLKSELFVLAQGRCRAAGDPLVLDLAGKGVKTAAWSVIFDLLSDGHPTETVWPGAGMALLAIDLDGNGRIDRGAELFGDRAGCNGARCFDGREALAAYDARGRGGNGDGLIDIRDRVYPRLLLWTDRNSDGVSQPDELVTLEKGGVLALDLKASYQPARIGGAAISAQLQVLTRDGFKDMFDLWLDMKVGLQNLAAMGPTR